MQLWWWLFLYGKGNKKKLKIKFKKILIGTGHEDIPDEECENENTA